MLNGDDMRLALKGRVEVTSKQQRARWGEVVADGHDMDNGVGGEG